MTSAAPRARAGAFWPAVRVRRPGDALRLALVALALVVLVLLAVLAPAALQSLAVLVPSSLRGLPGALLAAANAATSLALLGVLLAVLGDALRHRRAAFTSAVLGGLLGLGGTALVGALSRAAGSSALRALVSVPTDPAVLPVAAATALLTAADLSRRRRWLGPSRVALAATVVVALGEGSLSVAGVPVGLLLGTGAGLLVRVAVGVVPARPDDDALLALLHRAAVDVTALVPREQRAGQARYDARTLDGAALLVTVVDPDRSPAPSAGRALRLARLRTAAAGRPTLSSRGELERRALSSALARAAGVVVPEVVALLPHRDALVLVERPVEGAGLGDAGPAEAAAGLRAAFRSLRRLHGAGLAHGALTVDDVVLLPGGTAGFRSLDDGQPAAAELQRQLDAGALLVAGALRTGPQEAVRALREAYDPDAGTTLAAVLQPLVLPRPTRTALRGSTLLDDLRRELTDASGGSRAVAAPRLERVRPRTVLSIAGATVAAHVLATQLSEVGLLSALGGARPGWLGVALLGSAATYLGAALALQAFVPLALPLGRTALVQLASSFLTLVTPPTVGHVGLNLRYLQRSGMPLTSATASVAVSQGVTVVVTVAVLLVCSWLSGVSGSRPALLPSGNVLVVLVVAAAALALLAGAPPTRRLLGRRVQPLLRRVGPQLVATSTDPRRLTEAVVGVLVLNAGNVLALDACLRAFSTSLDLPALVVVYLAASTVGSAAPTPGGLGAVEAALVGGLTATGVPVAPALTAVLAFRTATFWLPAPVGWVALTALQRRERV